MRIRAGYDLAFQFPQPTPMVLMLRVHPSRTKDLLTTDNLIIVPTIPIREYVDGFGNLCSRIVAPVGRVELKADFIISDTGMRDEMCLDARQYAVEDLPDDALVFLLGSRYCDTQSLF